MREAVGRDLSDSAFDFQRVIWPVIGPLCGGGRLVPVESVAEGGFDRVLDTQSGIDAWQVVQRRGVIRGVASRVQWSQGGKNWRSFTVRMSRDNGAITEFEKRCYAIDHGAGGWLFPALTVQGYVTERRFGDLAGAAVMGSRELYSIIRDGRCCTCGGHKYRGGHECICGAVYHLGRPTSEPNATFAVVWWDTVRRLGCTIHEVPDLRE